MTRRVAVVAVGFWLAFAGSMAGSGTALAGGFSNPDFGIRRMGMFAVTARPDDNTAVFHNPAGLTLVDGTHFYHAQSWFVVDLGMRLYDSQGVLRPDYEIKPEWNVGAIPFIGFQSDCGTRDFRLGFGMYAPNAYGASLPKDEPTRYHATQALFLSSRATLAAAYRINEVLRVGASISLVYTYLTASRMMNRNMIPSDNDLINDPKYDLRFKSVAETESGDMTLDMNGQNWTWAADVGLLIHPIPTVRIGAAFAGGSAIKLKGDVKLTEPGGKVSKAKHETFMTIPWTLKGGINWEFVPGFEVGVDVYYWHYQILQEQRTVLSTPLYGMKELRDPRNYGNSWAWNIGMMYKPTDYLDLMIGYQQDYSPIPTRTYSLDNPSTDQFGISMGLRWQITDRWRAGIAYIHNWFNLINVQDNVSKPPVNAKGHGANNEFAFDFSYRF
jgi:long-chain fatty acid transport protein